jgi:hypothetical protein
MRLTTISGAAIRLMVPVKTWLQGPAHVEGKAWAAPEMTANETGPDLAFPLVRAGFGCLKACARRDSNP